MSISEPSPQMNSLQQRLIQLLDVAIALSQASGGAIWTSTQGDQPQLATQRGLGNQRIDKLQANWPGHEEKLEEVVETRTNRTLNASFETAGAKSQALQLILLPMVDGEQIHGVLELFLPLRASPSLSSVIDQLEELLNLSFSSFNDNSREAAEFSTWIRQLNLSLDLKATAYSLANETRRWSHWDRVSVAVMRGREFSVFAISGLDTFDRRAGAVREIESLANSCKDLRGILVYPSGEGEQTAITQRLVDYIKRVSAEQVLLLPLVSKNERPSGFLVFENFRENPNASGVQKIQMAQAPASLVLQHALDYERANSNVFARTLRNVLSKSGAKAIFAMLLIGLVVAALSLIQADLVITGTGVLQPELRQDLFAGTTGIVEKVHVSHGQPVNAGDALITLRSPDLELEINRVTGEQFTIQQQMNDLETLRSDPRRSSEQSTSPAQQAARVEELKTVITSLNKQLRLLEKQQQDLVVTSPIDGMILTWNIDVLLQGRPVNRTDRLLSVAKLDGPWVMELQIDHRDIGPVTRAIEAKTATVSFVTANNPKIAQQAVIKEVSPALTIDPLQGPILKVNASFDQTQLTDIQPGTTVISRIHCERSSVGYVWFRRFIDRTRAWWVLW